MESFLKRSLSWSSISSFKYDKEKWYDSYILGIKQTSREMDFGSVIDKRIQKDPTFIPLLPRYPLMQHKMEVMFGGIPLIGYPDGLDIDKPTLADFKTGKVPWTKKRADETGQLTMYLLLLFITKKIKPEEFKCLIHWLPTQENGDFSISLVDENVFHTFETKRTMTDVLKFGNLINETHKEMVAFIESKLSTFA